MARKWIKLWGEKLLSSINFRCLHVAEKGTYMCLLLIARTEGEHQGKLVFPNGHPMTTKDIAETLGCKRHETTERHLLKLVNLGMLEVCGEMEGNLIYLVRKYAELQTLHTDVPQTSHKRSTNVKHSSNKSTGRPIHSNDLRTPPDTEEKRSRREVKNSASEPRWVNQPGVENLQKKWGFTFRIAFLRTLSKEFGAMVFAEALKAAIETKDERPREPERYLYGIARKISRNQDDGEVGAQLLAGTEAII